MAESIKQITAPGEIVDADAVAIGEIYNCSEASFIESMERLTECGHRLNEIKRKLGHGPWLRWVATNAYALGFGKSTAQRLMKAARLDAANKANTAPARLSDIPTALKISRQIWVHKGEGNHLAMGSGENEWYTPPEYIALAREVMGGVDLDPASSAGADKVVGAATFFDADADGLAQEWAGRVWLNPPYTQPHIADFVSKMVCEVQSGRVESAIMLTHNYTDTRWFHEAASTVDAICFTRGRIKFQSPEGEVAAPTQGQAFFYFGPLVGKFTDVFSAIGFVATPHHGEV